MRNDRKKQQEITFRLWSNYLKVRFSLVFFFFIIVEPDVVLCVHPLLAFNLPQSSSTAGGYPCEWTMENSLNLFLSVWMSSLHGWSRVLHSVYLSHYTGRLGRCEAVSR